MWWSDVPVLHVPHAWNLSQAERCYEDMVAAQAEQARVEKEAAEEKARMEVSETCVWGHANAVCARPVLRMHRLNHHTTQH